MSKAKFIEIVDGRAPKRFAFKMETHEAHNWQRDTLMQWVHANCSGEVWYEFFVVDPYVIRARAQIGAHTVLRVWFAKRKDAMLYKLINLTT